MTQTASLWTISDMHGRQHSVTFSDDQVTAVRLEQFGTESLAQWTFGYSEVSLSLSACGLTQTEPADKRTFEMKFLTSITRPDGSTYSMPLPEYAISTGQQFCNPTTGRLRGMTLPTRGKIEWDYGLYPFPRESCPTAGCALNQQFTPNEAVQGIVEQRLQSSTGSTVGTWNFGSAQKCLHIRGQLPHLSGRCVPCDRPRLSARRGWLGLGFAPVPDRRGDRLPGGSSIF